MKITTFPEKYQLNKSFKLKVRVDGQKNPEPLSSYVIKDEDNNKISDVSNFSESNKYAVFQAITCVFQDPALAVTNVFLCILAIDSSCSLSYQNFRLNLFVK